jgi:quaternary ammonium compound-resistance protein SugE
MAWIYLILAATLETCWMFSLKFLAFSKFKLLTFQNFITLEGLSIWLPLAGYILFGIANVYFFSLAMKTIPSAIAFTIWTAMSITFIKIVEVTFFKGTTSALEIFFLGMILIGIVGLKVVSKPV